MKIIQNKKIKVLIEAFRHEVWKGTKITLVVACGNLKGGRGDWLIEKATELNAYKFIPLMTERCQVILSL